MPPSLEQMVVANDKFSGQSKTPENPCRQHPFGLISYQGQSIEDLHKEEALAEMLSWTQDCGAAVGTMYSGFIHCTVLIMMWVWKLGFKKYLAAKKCQTTSVANKEQPQVYSMHRTET